MVNRSRVKLLSLLLVAIFVGAALHPVQAVMFLPTDGGDDTGLLNDNAEAGLNLGQSSPTLVVLNLINAALSLLAAVCVGLLLYAGFLWVWARGNQDEVTRAKDIIRGTVIGLVIVLASLGITQFVFQTIGDITNADINTGAE